MKAQGRVWGSSSFLSDSGKARLGFSASSGADVGGWAHKELSFPVDRTLIGRQLCGSLLLERRPH
jgi:hypothetical protein